MKRKLTKILSMVLIMVMLLGLTMPMASADTAQVEAFVERLYDLVLQRPSEPEGKAGWVEALTSGREDGAAVAHGFFFSPEMNARVENDLTDAEYVNILYLTLMNRTPAQEETDAWVRQMTGGWPIEDIFHGFVMSDEFEFVCNEYGINRGIYTPPAGGEIRAFVTRLYTLVLNRPADPAGIDGWTEALLSGRATGAEVAHGFFFSDEFLNRPLSEDEIINILYQTLLERKPSQADLDAWVARMAEVPREDIFEGFVMSEEFAEICERFGIIRGTFIPPPFTPGQPETPQQPGTPGTPEQPPSEAVPLAPAFDMWGITEDNTFNVAVTQPMITGGLPITGYQYSIDNGATWVRATLLGFINLWGVNYVFLGISGLNTDESYTFIVRAVNATGPGLASQPFATP